ncbi:MAG: beta-ketoacyl-[acyl-carrier-protein] synthase family protein [Xanthomonadaceae bacterium]|nr:beta-ketoacyl-[acyl-carrier-protein] synthase family protein [Xanthomonadaceae bacterium]
MSSNAIAITGLGVLSPIGCNIAELADSISTARSGISLIDAPPLARSFAAGVIDRDFTKLFKPLERPFLDRCQQMAILAADQAIEHAGLGDLSELGVRAGVHYGNVNGGVSTAQAWYQQLLNNGAQAARPFSAMAIMGNAGAAHISIRHGIRGPVLTHATACASSGVAIAEAARAIATGRLDVAIAGGAEAPLTASLIGVFDGTRALSKPDPEDPARTCKPFSIDRSGLVLGEGAAFLVLESIAHAQARGADIIGYVAGSGIASDAHHIGMPQSEGQILTLRDALRDAGLSPRDIDYINAHATATNGGDEIESTSLRTVFGDGSDAPRVSSTKSVHGHLLGATSALEAVITLVAMERSILPATAHLDNIDPDCALRHIQVTPVPDHPIRAALSFSCGFGGTNVALVFTREHWS